MKKYRITWRGMLLFLYILYVYKTTMFLCGGLVAFSFAVCILFLLSVRPLILGEARRFFKSETQCKNIHDSSERGEEIYAEPDDDDLP